MDLARQILALRKQNALLKNDIWASFKTLSTNTSENRPLEALSDSDDSDWADDEYSPKTTAVALPSDASNEALKATLASYKSYNAALADTLDDYAQSLENVLDCLVHFHCTNARTVQDSVADSLQATALENDRTTAELLQAQRKLDSLNALGSSLLAPFNSL